MRSLPSTIGALLAVTTLALAGCSLPEAGGNDESAAEDPVILSFSYEADGGARYIDQTLTITNTGTSAAAPTLDIEPLDADGEVVPGVEVVTAFGSDRGEQVVPAETQVIDIVKFKGKRADDVVDVDVTVTDPGPVDDDVPPANDLRVKRFDVTGSSTNDNTLGSVLIRNTYDRPIRVMIVGIQFADPDAGADATVHFKQVSPLAGPLELQPGEKVREKVAPKYRLRFFGSVRAYLVA